MFAHMFHAHFFNFCIARGNSEIPRQKKVFKFCVTITRKRIVAPKTLSNNYLCYYFERSKNYNK